MDLACGALAASCHWHSQSKHHLRKKSTDLLPISICLHCVGHCGAGSTLPAHYHVSAPVVAATAAAPSIHHCRQFKDLLIRGARGRQCGGEESVRVSFRWKRPDHECNHRAFASSTADSFIPQSWRYMTYCCHCWTMQIMCVIKYLNLLRQNTVM